ncbi:MAG: hypothetical protein LBS50_00065 [Prevotellaceae bacterium]|jgi:hypothetical protein|nr:hypothetical protein [Prevotellaceae bacterium]
MKKLIILLISAISIATAPIKAQNCDVLLIPFVQDNIDPLPEESRSYLTTKLTQIITQNGISAGEGVGQFYLAAKFTLLSKDIVSGSPVMITQKVNAALSIVDYFGEKVFASVNIELQATGTNDTKAYINGLRGLNPNNPKIQEFIKSSKEKMLRYYDDNAVNIIKKAQKLADTKEFEEALFYLASIPECCKSYDAALAETRKVYQAYIDYTCQKHLMLARTSWAAAPNYDGANEAGQYLSFIEPDAKCYNEALALYNEIKASVKEDWKYEFKYYDERALERERINAYREVGVAYGKGQQPKTTIITGLLR